MKKIVGYLINFVSLLVMLIVTRMVLDYGFSPFEAVLGGVGTGYIFSTVIELAIEN